MKRKLITLALITVMICMVLGNIIACMEEAPPELPEITKIIAGVPDANQPPTQNLTSTVSKDNYCAPMAMVNILAYWEGVVGNVSAVGVIDPTDSFQSANRTAEYLGYFMDTNNQGSPDRGNDNDLHKGTYASNISPGAWEFVRWDNANEFPKNPPPNRPFALPGWKLGHNWTMTDDYVVGFPFYKAEIDAGRPLVACFLYWNPIPTEINFTDPGTNETIYVFEWGESTSSSSYPEEEWNFEEGPEGIGHAVTGVGYIPDWDPWGVGGVVNWVIVHDNWDTTKTNVAIPWSNNGIRVWNSNHAVDPGP